MSGPDGSPNRLNKLFATQDLSKVRAQVLVFAVRVARSRHAAEDLVQEAFVRALDPEADPWRPEVEPLLAKHLMRIVDNIQRGKRAHRAVERDPRHAAVVEERMKPPSATPEDTALVSEEDARAARTLEAVKLELRDDPLALQIVELSESGEDRPLDQAEATGRPVEDIRNARKRVQRAIGAVLQMEQVILPEPPRPGSEREEAS